MCYYKQPQDFAQMDKIVDMYEKMGVDRLAAWTYRGGHGTVLAAPDALKLWDRLGNELSARFEKITLSPDKSDGALRFLRFLRKQINKRYIYAERFRLH